MLLYCFPHAGGAESLYRAWAEELAPDAEVRVLGRGSRPSTVAPAAPVTALASALADRLRAENGPFAFLGHSLGALIAFETARELRAKGAPGPHTLIASGHVAPHLPSPGPELAELPTEKFWEEVRLLGGTPPELMESEALREVAEPGLRAEFRAAEGYRYSPGLPLDCPVLALAGTEDDRAPAELMAPWRMHTTGDFELQPVPGGHFFIAENTARVLDSVRSRLTAAVR
ncbi:thioesterase II family protein [Streptomyces sp. NBC_00572]|uniref:thioesterase II family protein n=1 Tax=Streptomyces sp. NBC_00572 TaxID=2903664 RepID=UPI002250CC93|nr:alpha/beta fold hydrolase [Streptomyces sp. NBC_00572]MCX4984981.1 alpha/beta fold hydrolase [Streptomyces sp. NBC_00572]